MFVDDVLRFPVRRFCNSGQKKRGTGWCPLLNVLDYNFFLPVFQGHLVDPGTVILLAVVAVHLVIDGYTLPACPSGRVVPVEIVLGAVESHGNVTQVVVRSALNFEDHVLPLKCRDLRTAYSGRNPTAMGVVPYLPGPGPAVTALTSKDQRASSNELVHVEFDGLRRSRIVCVEVEIVHKVVSIVVGGTVKQHLVPPESIRVRRAAAQPELGSSAIQ